MAKDFVTGGDVSSDISSDLGNDVARSDFGGDLAGDNGVDLNESGGYGYNPDHDASGDTYTAAYHESGEVRNPYAGSENEGFAKAAMAYEAPPPPDYTTDAIRPPDSAIYTEAPEHAGKTPEQIAAEMAEAWDYAGPANESEGTESPPNPEYGDSPPDDD